MKENKPAKPQDALKRHALSTTTVEVVEVIGPLTAGTRVDPNVIALVNNMSPADAMKNMSMFNIRNIVQASSANRIDRVKKAQEIIAKGVSGIAELPLSLLIRPPDFHSSFQFHNSEDKEDVLEQIVGTIMSRPGGRRFADDVRSICDEFYTNVIFNAYLGPNARATRTKATSLPDDKPGEIHIATSESELLLAVFDMFGSLDPDALISKISKSFSMGVSRSISYSTGGAGIGCRLVLDRSQRYWVIVLEGLFTAFCSIMPFGSEARSTNIDIKDIHFLKFKR